MVRRDHLPSDWSQGHGTSCAVLMNFWLECIFGSRALSLFLVEVSVETGQTQTTVRQRRLHPWSDAEGEPLEHEVHP